MGEGPAAREQKRKPKNNPEKDAPLRGQPVHEKNNKGMALPVRVERRGATSWGRGNGSRNGVKLQKREEKKKSLGNGGDGKSV